MLRKQRRTLIPLLYGDSPLFQGLCAKYNYIMIIDARMISQVMINKLDWQAIVSGASLCMNFLLAVG